jgi:hypothetical protein
MRSFREIGLDVTDKINHHRYDRFYPMFLEKFRDQDFNMLEIGVWEFGSFKLWREYFPQVKMWGVDIDFKTSSDSRLTLIIGDQSTKAGIEEISKNVPKCKVIIDDGSHIPEHQINTFHHLWKNNLESGGVYIIEDIECTYWREDATCYGYPTGNLNIIDHFRGMLDAPNQEMTGYKNRLGIETITFAHNSIILTKSLDEDLPLYNRPYRFSHSL